MITPAMLRAAVEGRSILDGTPQGIEASEKAGQQELVRSTNMPIDLMGTEYGEDGRPEFEAVGFTFGAKIDELFQEATLPKGWTRSAGGHSMHSDILDEKGRKRVSVFYKAAFYDRKAHAHLVRRYSAGNDYRGGANGEYQEPTRACIFDHDNTVIAEWPFKAKDRKGEDIANKAAVNALNDRFPDWANPSAYWD